MQHLAAMLKDVELGAQVNLYKSTQYDRPKDVYSYLLKHINEAIHKIGEESSVYSHFKLIELTRSIVKTPIMTKIYNVTKYRMGKQIENKLNSTLLDVTADDGISRNIIEKEILTRIEEYAEKAKNKSDNKNTSRKKKYFFSVPGINGDVKISREDVLKIATIIDEQIFIVFPSLNDIYNYFTKIV